MHLIAVPTVLGVEDWLPEELPQSRRFDDSMPGSLVLCGAAEDGQWEFTEDDEFDDSGAGGGGRMG